MGPHQRSRRTAEDRREPLSQASDISGTHQPPGPSPKVPVPRTHIYSKVPRTQRTYERVIIEVTLDYMKDHGLSFDDLVEKKRFADIVRVTRVSIK